MDEISNPALYQKKLSLLKEPQLSINNPLYTIHCKYHGIHLTIHARSERFSNSLKNFIPKSWIISENLGAEIYLVSPVEFELSLNEWSDESSQDCYSLEENKGAIQRDFAANTIDGKIFLICDDIVCDGFHNFLRWYLSERLMSLNKFVIHASCVLDKFNEAHIFLGHSEAGKTTMTKLATPRLVLGDDMNIITVESQKLYVEAGAIGGQFSSMIGYEKSAPVKSLYWLNQASENSLERLSERTAHQKLLASFANLHWPTLPEETLLKLMNFSHEAISLVPLYQLNFKPEAEVWNLIDP